MSPGLLLDSSLENWGPRCHLVTIPCPAALPSILWCSLSRGDAQNPTEGWSAVPRLYLRPGSPGARVRDRGHLEGICLSFGS